MQNKHKKGFTLIELLVVIAIIGLLASIVLVSLNTARVKARDTKRIADLKQVQLALEMRYDKDKKYIDTDTSACVDLTGSALAQEIASFLPNVPADPINDADHKYQYGATATDYIVIATLESEDNNPNKGRTAPAAIGGCSSTPSSATTNYWVSTK